MDKKSNAYLIKLPFLMELTGALVVKKDRQMTILFYIFCIKGSIRKMRIYNVKHFDTSLMRHYKS